MLTSNCTILPRITLILLFDILSRGKNLFVNFVNILILHSYFVTVWTVKNTWASWPILVHLRCNFLCYLLIITTVNRISLDLLVILNRLIVGLINFCSVCLVVGVLTLSLLLHQIWHTVIVLKSSLKGSQLVQVLLISCARWTLAICSFFVTAW